MAGPPRRQTRRLAALVAFALSVAACTQSGTLDERDEGTPRARPDVTSQGDTWLDAACSLDLRTLRIIERGMMPGRSPDIIFLPRLPHFVGGFTYTAHSGPYRYLQEVPLVFYGPGFIRRRGAIELDRTATVADIAPTIAELVGFDFPNNRPGRVIDEALLPSRRRSRSPALVVVVVWDGGGVNVLERWPNAWPNLKRMMRQGTSVSDALVGSSPSVTAAIHATIGTGAFPRTHGLVDSYLRLNGGIIRTWEGVSPRGLRTATLADLYDRSMDNRPRIGAVAEHPWHISMVGRGAAFPGGDHDIAVWINPEGDAKTNPSLFSLPPSAVGVAGLDKAIRTVDTHDGKIDGRWMGHPFEGPAKGTPAWTLHQTDITRSVLRSEGFGLDGVPDLFFTNYKELDLVGHDFNMMYPEVQSALALTDGELPDLKRFLNNTVGPRKWVMIVTADHGQQPDAESTGAWPVGVRELASDLENEFASESLVQQTRVTGFWLDRAALKASDATTADLSNFMLDYTIADNAPKGVTPDYRSRRNQKIIRAALPAKRLDDVFECARSK